MATLQRLRQLKSRSLPAPVMGLYGAGLLVAVAGSACHEQRQATGHTAEKPPASSSPSPSRSSREPASIVEKFNDAGQHRAADHPLQRLTATLSITPVQVVAAGGIHATIDIVNNGAADEELHNPLDGLSVILGDALGYPLRLPPGDLRGLRDEWGPEKDRIELPFQIESVEMDGRRLKKEEIERRRIVFGPRARLRIGILIDRVVPEDAPPDSSGGRISAGEYSVQVSLFLRHQDGGYRWMQSGQVKITLLGQGR